MKAASKDINPIPDIDDIKTANQRNRQCTPLYVGEPITKPTQIAF